MKNFIKYAAVGLAGYFVGFYEFKYRITKLMLKTMLSKEVSDVKQEAKEEEGSQ